MRTVALEIVETTEEIYISVWDSGQEIPEKLRENILEYGVTTKKGRKQDRPVFGESGL